MIFRDESDFRRYLKFNIVVDPDTLFVLRQLARKEREKKRKEEIEKIAQQYNVSSLMARLYYYNQNITDDFLLSRKKRMQAMFEDPTDFTWKDLYEVLLGGEKEIEKIVWRETIIEFYDEVDKWRVSVGEILTTIDNILSNINRLSITREDTIEFEVKIVRFHIDTSKTDTLDSTICRLTKNLFPFISKSITRYLATEFPTNFNFKFDLEPFAKEIKEEHYFDHNHIAMTVCLKVRKTIFLS